MTIWDLEKKSTGKITGINNQLDSSVRRRLEEMGFVEGENVYCMKRTVFKGPLVIQLQDCVYTIDKSLAQSVDVNPS